MQRAITPELASSKIPVSDGGEELGVGVGISVDVDVGSRADARIGADVDTVARERGHREPMAEGFR